MANKVDNRCPTEGRLIFIAILKKLFGYSLLLLFIYCFLTFNQQLNMININRLFSYLNFSSLSVEDFTEYKFEAGLENKSVPFSGGFVVLNSDSLKIINAAGTEDFSVQLKYKEPRLLKSNNRIIAYGKNSNNISIFGNYTLTNKLETAYPILNCNVNQKGDFLLFLDDPNYKSSISFYSDDFEEIFSLSSSEYYLLSGCINQNGDTISLFCVDAKSGDNFIKTYDIYSSDPLYTISMPLSSIYSLEYDNNKNLTVITNDGVYYYNEEGDLISQFDYNGYILNGFNHENGRQPLISLSSGGSSNVQLLDGDTATHSFTSFSDISNLSYDDSNIYVLSHSQIYIHNLKSDTGKQYPVSMANSVSKRGSNEYLILAKDKASILKK